MQLPFRNAKFDILIDEPGLGRISGCRITIKTQACNPLMQLFGLAALYEMMSPAASGVQALIVARTAVACAVGVQG